MLRRHKTDKDVKYILEHLRLEDKEELKQKFGKKWKKIVLKKHLNYDFDVLVDKKTNKPFLMGGIKVLDKNYPELGCVWLLSTDLIAKHKLKLAKLLINELAIAEKQYFMIFNYIWHNNLTMKKFIQKLGFTISSDKKYNCSSGWEFFFKQKQMKGLS